MRLIDADALIEICKDVIKEEWNKTTQPCSWSHAYADFIDNIEDMPTVNRWHDLRKNPEDLPNKNGTYICTVQLDDLFKLKLLALYNYDSTKIKWYCIGSQSAIREGEIIAWKEIEPFED